MQNDLDLRIEVNGKSYEPWILTPTKGHVTDEAKRGDDNRNNIEQVTLTKAELTGVETLTLHVRNKGVASGKQNFAITWWFYSEEGKILTPAVGDIYTPAQTMYLHLQDITAPYTVEISYDNGKTFNTLKKVETQRSHLEIQIPKNAPLWLIKMVMSLTRREYLPLHPHQQTYSSKRLLAVVRGGNSRGIQYR